MPTICVSVFCLLSLNHYSNITCCYPELPTANWQQTYCFKKYGCFSALSWCSVSTSKGNTSKVYPKSVNNISHLTSQVSNKDWEGYTRVKCKKGSLKPQHSHRHRAIQVSSLNLEDFFIIEIYIKILYSPLFIYTYIEIHLRNVYSCVCIHKAHTNKHSKHINVNYS